MILTGKEIQKRIGNDIVITPYSEKQLNPNSYNLRLHEELLVYTELPLDMKKPNPAEKLVIPESGLLLKPGILYLGRTLESTETHNLVPMLEGRSSIGRLGMLVHVTAGFGDVGFKGFLDFRNFGYPTPHRLSRCGSLSDFLSYTRRTDNGIYFRKIPSQSRNSNFYVI